MIVSEELRDELIRTIKDPKNKTGGANIPIAEYQTKTERYVFAITAQKFDLKPKATITNNQCSHTLKRGR